MKHTEPQPTDAGRMDFNWYTGINCYFDVDDITISVWASGWSGREEVRVDGELVSAQRVLRCASRHVFQVRGIEYEVRLRCQSILTGTFTITLLRNGIEIDSDQGSYADRSGLVEDGELNWPRAIRRVAPVFLLSGLAGIAFGYALGKLLG